MNPHQQISWTSKPLRRLATIKSSNVDKIIEEGEQTVRLCNYVDVYYNDRITGDLAFSEGSATPQEVAKFALRPNDVVITKDSETPDDIAVPALINESAEGVVCGYHLAILRPHTAEVHGPYLFWSLVAKPTREAFGNAAQGVTRYGLTLNGIGSIPIPVPDLDTQKTIAVFLDRETARIDQLIAKKERQAAVLTEREETAFLGIVTGQQREGLRAYSGVDWIGDIPAHWTAPKFTHVARQETGHTPSRKEESYWIPQECIIPWFSLADVWQIRDGGQIYVNETAEKISEVGMENSAARLLPAGTVILSRTASVGFPAILSIPMATTQDFVGWICSNRVRSKFLYYVLRSMKPVFRRLMMGSTHQTIYMPDIRSFRLPLPPIDEQDAIVRELDRTTGAFRLAATNITESVTKLREYRAALITAAVTGQFDIREKLPAVVADPDRSKFRLAVGAEIIHRHQNTKRLGRNKNQKLLYLAEAHAGIKEIDGNYIRWAAGPYDAKLIDEVERSLEDASYFQAQSADSDSQAVAYVPLSRVGQHSDDLKSLLGDRLDALRKTIDLLRDFEVASVEAVATLYAVWNDALIDGETPDDARIIRGVLTEWHEEKPDKFKKADLEHWLDWMRRSDFVPRGQGPRTIPTMTGDLFR